MDGMLKNVFVMLKKVFVMKWVNGMKVFVMGNVDGMNQVNESMEKAGLRNVLGKKEVN